jgi:competence protein ComEA
MKKRFFYAGLLLLFLISWFGRYEPLNLGTERREDIEVEIKGEVNAPGIVRLPWNATLEQGLEAAGGVTEKGDLSGLNLARVLSHHEAVTVPEIQEIVKVSISAGDVQSLCTLPGIGPAIAQRIVDYRNESGFTCLEDLMNVKGIGEKTFEKIKDYIQL